MTKILIVEDEAGLRQGLEINLRHENYETVTAADGEEAVRLFHAESPDLVLLDLMLPKKSGFEVLDHIRKMSKVPVILLTARGQETDKVRGLRGEPHAPQRDEAGDQIERGVGETAEHRGRAGAPGRPALEDGQKQRRRD